jgi:hypothetical protein
MTWDDNKEQHWKALQSNALKCNGPKIERKKSFLVIKVHKLVFKNITLIHHLNYFFKQQGMAWDIGDFQKVMMGAKKKK